MNLPLISIIVPVYNTIEDYLCKCIKSLVLQDYSNIEILLVDDGSNKITAELCDKISEENEIIRVFHKTNGGVSSARNLGLENAKGKYILFVDSDDWVDSDFVSTLLNGIQNSNADIAITKFYYEETKLVDSDEEVYNRILNVEELIIDIISSDEIGGYLCNKIFKAEFIKTKLDENLHFCEDLDFVLNYTQFVNTAVFINKCTYHYFVNDNSITALKKYNFKIFSVLEAYDKLINVYFKNKKIKSLLHMNKLRISIKLRTTYKVNNINNPSEYRIIKKAILKSMFIVLFAENISLKTKFILFAKSIGVKK